jgi:glutathione S-transferase
LKLYMFPIAPNPTRVRLYLAEKRALGCDVEVEEVVVNLIEGEQKKPEHLARNPFGVLPVLEMDNGEYLIESRTIIDYVEDLHPEPSIWGVDPEARAHSRQLERMADIGCLMMMGGIVHATNSPLDRPAEPEIARHYRERLEPKLAYFEELLSDGRTFLTGDTPSVADCTLSAGLQFGRFRDIDFVEHSPAIRNWDAQYRSRDVVSSIYVA